MNALELLKEANARRQRGDEQGALHSFELAAEYAADFAQPGLEAQALLGAGELHGLLDDPARARTCLEAAIARSMEAGTPLVEADAWLALAHGGFDAGRSKDAHDALLEAMALYRDLDGEHAKRGLARTVRLYGEHIGVLGDATEARQALELARIMYLELGDGQAAQGIAADLERLHDYAR